MITDSAVRTLLRDAARGAVAGAAATGPMSAVMLTAGRLGLMGTQPPRRVTDAALDAAGVPASGPARDAVTAVTHTGFGALAGVPFAVVLLAAARRRRPPRTPATLPAAAAGVAYGLGVWASAYLGWVPALGILPRADRDRPDRPVAMVLAHVVYGAVLGAAAAGRRRPVR